MNEIREAKFGSSLTLDYWVTDMGIIRIKTQGGRLRRETDGIVDRQTGHLVWTWNDVDAGKALTRRVDRLVLNAFRPEGGDGKQPRHVNGDTHDSRLENLEWA